MNATSIFRALLAASVVLLPSTLQGQDDPLLGTFASDALKMTVVSAGDGGYAGRFEVGTDVFPFSADAVAFAGAAMRGTYRRDGSETAFEAMLSGEALIVGDGTGTVLLQRTSDVAGADLTQEILAEAGAPPRDAVAAHPVPAAEAGGAPDGEVDGGAVVEAPEAGLRFVAPEGWAVREESGFWLLQSRVTPGQIMVIPHDHTTLDEIRAAARQGYTDRTTRLRLAGDVAPFGRNGVRGDFAGTVGGLPVQAFAVGLVSEHGGGVSLLAAADSAAFGDAQRDAVESLAGSVLFTPRRAPSVATTWSEKLQDARLTYMYGYYSGGVDGAYVGASEETIIDLCRGYFSYGSSSSLSADGGFGASYNATGSQASSAAASGTWQVVEQATGAVLRLSFHDGTVREYVVTTGEDGSGTYLDGDRFYRTYASSPVDDARPSCS